MFDVGWSEIIVIAVVAIVVVGPKDLPRMLRTVGQTVGRMKRMAGEFQSQFNQAIRETELDDVRKEVDKARRMNPIRDEMNSVRRSIDTPHKKPPTSAPKKPVAAPAKLAATSKVDEPAAAEVAAPEPLSSESVLPEPDAEARPASGGESAKA